MTLDEFGQSVCQLQIQRNEHRSAYQDAKTYLETMEALEILRRGTGEDDRNRLHLGNQVVSVHPHRLLHGVCTHV